MPFYPEADRQAFNVPARTFGRRKPPKMDEAAKKTKAAIGPDLYAQLDAVSKGRWVNHLGGGHRRVGPYGQDRRLY